MTSQSGTVVLINGFGVLFVILNSFGLGLRLPIGKMLGQGFAHWKIVGYLEPAPVGTGVSG